MNKTIEETEKRINAILDSAYGGVAVETNDIDAEVYDGDHIKDMVLDLVQKEREEALVEVINAYETWQWEEPEDGKRIPANEVVRVFVKQYLSQTKGGRE